MNRWPSPISSSAALADQKRMSISRSSPSPTATCSWVLSRWRAAALSRPQPPLGTARQDARKPQQGGGDRPPDVQVLLAAGVQALLQQRQRLIELAAAEPDQAGESPGDGVRVRVPAGLGGPLGAVQVRVRRIELAQFGQGEGEPAAGGDERDARLRPLGLAPRALERVDVLLQDELGPPVVSLRVVAVAEIAARQRLERGVVDGASDPQAPLAVFDGQLRLALEVAV